jgi:hypothetical protein
MERRLTAHGSSGNMINQFVQQKAVEREKQK